MSHFPLEVESEEVEFQTLHALRIGLKAKVECGELSSKQAYSIFEDVRRKLNLRSSKKCSMPGCPNK